MDRIKESDRGWQNGMAKSITLIVTKDCQLACKYCYLVGKNSKERMTWEVAKEAIDYILDREDEFREESVTLAPDGRFYVCPAFYIVGNASKRYSQSQRLEALPSTAIGDLATGLSIANQQLFRLDHAPTCFKKGAKEVTEPLEEAKKESPSRSVCSMKSASASWVGRSRKSLGRTSAVFCVVVAHSTLTYIKNNGILYTKNMKKLARVRISSYLCIVKRLIDCFRLVVIFIVLGF